MLGTYRVRTDLAVESREKFEKDNVEIEGVVIHESYQESKDLKTTVVKIETEEGARTMEKPCGTYITMEAPNLVVPDEDYHREISVELADHLRKLLGLTGRNPFWWWGWETGRLPRTLWDRGSYRT